MARRGGKREQRKREKGRAESGSPYVRFGFEGELIACYMNSNWREYEMVSCFVLRRLAGHGHAMGAFLIDLSCLGLKDAWGRLDISAAEFRDIIESQTEDVALVPAGLEVVQRFVAGGIRFAEQNGFRLPPRYERWLALLGNMGDSGKADMSDFAAGGKLRYTGSIEDLKRRLLGCTVEEFLQREDVECDFGPEIEAVDDETQVAIEQVAGVIREKGAEAVRKWCFANSEAPHPRVAEAWDVTIEAMMQTDGLPEDEGKLAAEDIDRLDVRVAKLLAFETPAGAADLRAALEQVGRFVSQFNSTGGLLEALGLREAFDDLESDE
jgi:hypothetical protein